MNPKQKKLIWIAGIGVAIWYFAPTFINTARQQAMIREQQAARIAKAQAMAKSPLPAPSAAGTIAGTSAPGASSVTPLPADYERIFGVWQGAGPQPGLGMCNLRLELRKDAADPSRVSGFPVLACAPVMSPFSRPSASQTQNTVMSALSPMSAVLTGTVQSDSVQFSVDKVMGNAPGGCSLTSFTVTPFGVDLISAEWHEATCQSGDQRGQILLKRMGR
jgi:hypothetical protein